MLFSGAPPARGAPELFDALARSQGEVQAVMSAVPGFISYEAFRTTAAGRP